MQSSATMANVAKGIYPCPNSQCSPFFISMKFGFCKISHFAEYSPKNFQNFGSTPCRFSVLCRKWHVFYKSDFT